MQPATWRTLAGQISKSLLVSVALVTCINASVNNRNTLRTNTSTKIDYHAHHLIVPSITFLDSRNCNQEAAAYASAIAALHDARRVADEAYRRWVDCELQGGGNGPRTELTVLQTPPIESYGTKREPPADWSILVDSAPRPVHDPLNPTARTASHQHESLPSR